MSKAALQRLAAEVRQEIGLNDSAPFDPWLWADAYGVPVLPLGAVGAREESVNHFVKTSPHLWSAALVQDGAGHVIVYNDAHALERTRSNLAHEASHIIAEHALTSAWLASDGRCASGAAAQEKEAAEIGGALLVPPAVAKVAALRGRPAADLAAAYCVSSQMATWRMRMSGGAVIARRSHARAC